MSYALRYSVWCVFLAMFALGCNDDSGKKTGGGNRSDNGVWLTYEDQSRALTVSVKTVNNRLDGNDVMFTVISSGFNKNAAELNKDSTGDEFVNSVHLATIRFSGTIERGKALDGQVFALSSDMLGNVITIDQDFEGVPGSLISTSGSLTLKRVDFEKKELYEQNDPAEEWTSSIQFQRLEYEFEGEFADFNNEDGPTYPLSGKVIFGK